MIADGIYGDGTSWQVTSDFRISDDLHTWTFIHPFNIEEKATVEPIGFRFGSIGNKVHANFYDINDILIGTQVLGNEGVLSFKSEEVGIHKIVFSQNLDDPWVIGSFAGETRINDIVFSGFNIIPEPTSVFFILWGIVNLFYFHPPKKNRIYLP